MDTVMTTTPRPSRTPMVTAMTTTGTDTATTAPGITPLPPSRR